MTKALNLVLTALVLALLCAPNANAQSTEITYQGNLKESGLPANANYDIEFKLYGALTGGSQIGNEVLHSAHAVVDGVFTVTLDFGQPGFPGQDRYLQISVRRAGVGSLVTLGPRQKISSAPYAIQSLSAATATSASVASNSLALGGMSASQFVITTDARLTDARSPLAGSPSYIQNTSSQQASSNFNITGNGTAGTFNATTAFRFGGNHLISAAGLDNTFAGSFSGLLVTSGESNAFYGSRAGQENKHGSFNAFFGSYAGQNNISGNNNSFFGYFAGNGTTTGNDNSFFGNRAGQVNTSGAFNSFFGTFSGFFNSTGSDNSYFGNETGFNNTNGSRNSFFGSKAGLNNSTGEDNAFLGSFAGRNNSTGSNNAYVGSKAGQSNVAGMNNSFFGAGAGLNNTASNNTFAGADAGKANSSGAHNTFVGRNAGLTTTEGELNTFIGTNAGSSNVVGRLNTIVGAEANVLGANLSYATAIGAEAIVNSSNTVVIGRPIDAVRIPGNMTVTGNLSAPNLSVSASNITGILPTANGGTGMSAPGAGGNFLRSTGTTWQSSGITAGDIPAGSGFYVQNTTVQQGSSNFNISGNGTAGGILSGNAVNSSTQYNIGGSRVLLANGANLFAGLGTGTANTTGVTNSFVGPNAGLNNTVGNNNTFFGANAGQANTVGTNNTVVGTNANVGSNNLTYATAIGADAVVSTNNTLVLGRGADTVRVPGNLAVTGTFTPPASFTISASNITGTLAAANGGTGLSVPGTTGNFLRSTGTGWQSQGLVALDLPGGSTQYIQNGAGLQAGAQFNVASGTVAGNLTVGGSLLGSFTVPAANISGVLGTTNGGTGLNNVGSTGHFLRSNGTSWTTTLLTPGDIPSLAAAYVQNTGIQQGGAQFNIGGNGTIGGSLTVIGAINGNVAASNITGTLGVTNGGTGLNSAGTNGHFLKSNGAGFTTTALSASDIPSLAANYVQNTQTAQGGANFNIGGSGTIGTNLSVVGNLNVGGALTGSFTVPAGNISGVLGTSTGGTGLGAPGASGNFLKSNGTIWTSSTLAAADVPLGSSHYIQNGITPQAGTNFNIAGDGTIGDDLTVNGDLILNGTLTGTYNVPAANVTGVLGTTNGGTGLNNVGSTGHFLRSNGTGWTTTLLTPGDIPSLGNSYIQNQTGQQGSSNFNVSGTGTVGTTMTVGTTLTVGTTMTADTVNAVTQYNINGTRVFATTGTNNIFAGAGAGNTGSSNAFFGANAGNSNVSGGQNTMVGANADVGSGTLSNATAIGANAQVTQSNSVVIGGITGVNSGADTRVGIGTTAPKTKLEVTGGDILVGTQATGIILKSPDGLVCARISLSNAGALVTTAVTCP